ncbi:hypothetical protein ACFVWN_14100 [Nocardiopsis flavescens]|uniref:hypothetical protein n=1 Tax=Nocardiopsis flavescens TaxID=758803 RepID=UPI003667A6A6
MRSPDARARRRPVPRWARAALDRLGRSLAAYGRLYFPVPPAAGPERVPRPPGPDAEPDEQCEEERT